MVSKFLQYYEFEAHQLSFKVGLADTYIEFIAFNVKTEVVDGSTIQCNQQGVEREAGNQTRLQVLGVIWL